jgi:hypothetical protein
MTRPADNVDSQLRYGPCRSCGLESGTQWTPFNCPHCGFSIATGYYDQAAAPGASRVVWTEHGLGVEAVVDISARTLIETAPVFVFVKPNQSNWEDLAPLIGIDKLRYSSGPNDGGKWWHLFLPFPSPVGKGKPVKKCICLGNVMLYNHSWDPNMTFWFREAGGRYFIDFWAVRDIRAGEELVWTYDTNEVWFPPYTKDPSAMSRYEIPEGDP